MKIAVEVGVLLIALSILITPVFAEVIDGAGDSASKLDKNAKTLDEKLDLKQEINVIVTLKEEATDARIDEIKNKIGSFKVNARGWKAVYAKGFAVTVTKEQMHKLLNDPLVDRVDVDKEVRIQLDTANKWSGVTKARSSPPTGYGTGVTGDRSLGQYNYNKNDVVIAIIDTGIDAKHKDLNGTDNGGTKKVIGWYDVINGITYPYDDQGHGTHVASIAAGEGNSISAYKGVAPGAALVGIKVLNSAGSGSFSGIITGVNWAVTNKNTYGIKIISMSLGGTGSSDGSDPLSVAVNNAVNQGIVAVVAAGNSGPQKYTISSPGAAANAITVGNIADAGKLPPTGTGSLILSDNGFYLAPSSSRGPAANNAIKPDVVAPGVNITAAKNTYPNTAGFHGDYISKTGTSMSTPFVAGTVALMLDVNYSLTPAQVKSMIRSSAEDYGVTGCDIDYGCGRLRAFRAIGLANGSMPSADQVVPKHLRYSAYQNDNTWDSKFPATVTSTNYPLAATLIQLYARGYYYPGMPSTSLQPGLDLDLEVRSPTSAIYSTSSYSGQDTISIKPSVTGVHNVNVTKYLGSGYYTLDISYQ